MKITVKPTFEKVRHDQENDNTVIVSLKAPKLEWERKRPSICVVAVTDISGSMEGPKLNYAKQTLTKMLDHLKPGDYMSAITFSDEAKLIFAPMEITQSTKEKLKTKIGALEIEGSTNFSGGMLMGLEQANKVDLPKDTVIRVILLSDGQANKGIADREGILKLLEANIGKATVSAFGYGTDADQELLADVARKGKGNFAFIGTPDAALSAFGKELGGLLSLYAQNIVIDVAPHGEHKIVEVISDVDVEEDKGKVKIKIPEILSEEERHIAIKMRLAEQKLLPRLIALVDVKVDYDFITENGKKEHRQEELKCKIEFVKDGEQQEKPTAALDEILGAAELVKAQIAADQQAKVGNFAGAQAVMRATAAIFDQRGLKKFSTSSKKLADKMSGHAVYAASAGYRTSAQKGMTRGMGASGLDDEAMADLRLAGAQVSNSMQEQAMASFTNGAEEPDAEPAALPAAPKAEEKKPTSLTKSRSKRW